MSNSSPTVTSSCERALASLADNETMTMVSLPSDRTVWHGALYPTKLQPAIGGFRDHNKFGQKCDSDNLF